MTDEQEGLKQELRILAENLSNLIRETNDTKEILTNFITGLQA
ncbi:MAG: hypothetical protein Q4B72_15425 [Lachnospiraceae bacterium]|nr:hypothetical protein [Lachnospiraceae bacterium]